MTVAFAFHLDSSAEQVPVWPFVGANDHRQWGRIERGDKDCCLFPETHIHEAYFAYRELLEEGSEGSEARARKKLKEIVKLKPANETEHMLYAMSLVKLAILLLRSTNYDVEVKDELEAYNLFKKAAVDYKVPLQNIFMGMVLSTGGAV